MKQRRVNVLHSTVVKKLRADIINCVQHVFDKHDRFSDFCKAKYVTAMVKPEESSSNTGDLDVETVPDVLEN
jgi:hypothetical protein